jgi:hypothetical protein
MSLTDLKFAVGSEEKEFQLAYNRDPSLESQSDFVLQSPGTDFSGLEIPMIKLRRIAIPILVSAMGISLAAAIALLLGNGTMSTWAISENKEINFSFTLQVMVLVVSFAAIGFVYFSTRRVSRLFSGLGHPGRKMIGTRWDRFLPLDSRWEQRCICHSPSPPSMASSTASFGNCFRWRCYSPRLMRSLKRSSVGS